MKKFLPLSLLVLACCSFQLPTDLVCHLEQMTITCSVPDAGPVGDAGDSGVLPDGGPDAGRDAAPDATLDSGPDARDAAPDSSVRPDAGDAGDASADAKPDVSVPQDAGVTGQVRGMNDIGFWRGGVDRQQLRRSMVAMGVRYLRIPMAGFAADADGTVDTPAWRQKLVDDTIAAGMVPIPVAFGSRSGIEATCSNDPVALSAVVDDWVGQDAGWLRTRSVVLNVANEWGPGDPANGMQDPGFATWRDGYVAAIGRIRAAGIQAPLLIDAPGCGQDAYGVARFGAAVAAADPLGRVMFSIHVYASFWTLGAAQSWQINVASGFDMLAATGLPVIIGEFSSNEFAGNQNVDPARVLSAARTRGFGFLAWESYNDSAENVFASAAPNTPAAYPPSQNLTPFGQAVLAALQSP